MGEFHNFEFLTRTLSTFDHTIFVRSGYYEGLVYLRPVLPYVSFDRHKPISLSSAAETFRKRRCRLLCHCHCRDILETVGDLENMGTW